MFDWWFRNRETGEITIAQFPNPPLAIALVAWGLRWVWRPTGTPATVLDAVGTAAIVWWAADELVRGVNPWRRLLGVVVLAWQASRLLRG